MLFFIPLFVAVASVKVTALPLGNQSDSRACSRSRTCAITATIAVESSLLFGRGEFWSRLVLGTHGLESRRLISHRNEGVTSIAKSRGNRVWLLKFLVMPWWRRLLEQQE